LVDDQRLPEVGVPATHVALLVVSAVRPIVPATVAAGQWDGPVCAGDAGTRSGYATRSVGRPGRPSTASIGATTRRAGGRPARPSTASIAATTCGSSCEPATRTSSVPASACVRAPEYGRSLVIAQKASAAATTRASIGIAVPARRSG